MPLDSARGETRRRVGETARQRTLFGARPLRGAVRCGEPRRGSAQGAARTKGDHDDGTMENGRSPSAAGPAAPQAALRPWPTTERRPLGRCAHAPHRRWASFRRRPRWPVRCGRSSDGPSAERVPRRLLCGSGRWSPRSSYRPGAAAAKPSAKKAIWGPVVGVRDLLGSRRRHLPVHPSLGPRSLQLGLRIRAIPGPRLPLAHRARHGNSPGPATRNPRLGVAQHGAGLGERGRRAAVGTDPGARATSPTSPSRPRAATPASGTG